MDCGHCKFNVPKGAIVCGHCGADFCYTFSLSKFIYKFPFMLFFSIIGCGILVFICEKLGFRHWSITLIIFVGSVVYAIGESIESSNDAYSIRNNLSIKCD